jgi:hypothetical protein
MSLLQSGARFVLFGLENVEITLSSITKRKLINAGRGIFGMPPNNGPGYWEWLKQQFSRWWAWVWGVADAAPAGIPGRLFDVVDGVLRSRGSAGDDVPRYWANAKGVVSSPFFWSIPVDYAPSADPQKIYSFELAIEDRISRAGYNLNVRIQPRPMRIEIDKPTVPMVKLADLWSEVECWRTDQRHALLGLAWKGGRTITLGMLMDGEDFSMFIAGSPGSGKTQLAMSILLSLAMTNSPTSLAIVVIDPKAIDFRPLSELPHLAQPIITEPTRAVEVLQALVGEMDERTRRAARGDVGFLQQAILLYLDEMSDLLNSLPAQQAETAAVNLQRLAQKGRGVGFVIIGATQRVYDIPASTHSKLNVRVVGKMRNANDSVAASGIPGTATNRLPGRGSFEIWCSDQQGLRIQAPFVADSSKSDYEAKLAPFLEAIRARWAGIAPRVMLAALDQSQAPEANTMDEPPRVEVPVELYQRLMEIGRVSQYRLRQLHRELYNRDINAAKAQQIIDILWGEGEPITA